MPRAAAPLAQRPEILASSTMTWSASRVRSRANRSTTVGVAEHVVAVGRAEGHGQRGLVAGDHRIRGQLDVDRRGRLAQLGVQGGGPAHQARHLVRVDRVARSRPDLGPVGRLGPRVGVVVEPPLDPDAPEAHRPHHEATVGHLVGLEDAGDRAGIGADVASADLGAAGDEDHPELPVAGGAVPHELPVARLEDVERQDHARQQDRAEGEHRGHRHPVSLARPGRSARTVSSDVSPPRWRVNPDGQL